MRKRKEGEGAVVVEFHRPFFNLARFQLRSNCSPLS